ncbi:MAG TPA: hypothetical protein VKU87_01760, partial [Thermomicrobiaceae bacterium]|nr:hypothetical protein [Thermomicrobiaceae bacterium]
MAGVFGAGTAGAETPPGSQADLIFFPWVPNGETLNNSNPWYGSIVIQNIESVPVNIAIGATAGGAMPMVATIQPHASYTFSASQLATLLGWTGKGGGAVVQATWVPTALPTGNICQAESGSISVQRNDEPENLPSGMTKTADQDVVAGLPAGAMITSITGYTKGADYTVSGNEITWIGLHRPADNHLYTVNYTYAACTRGPAIGGVEKQAAPATSGFLVETDSTMTSVDGYTGIPDTDVAWGVDSKFCQAANPNGQCNNLGIYQFGFPVGGFDGTSYLPIVQSNWFGWDTYLHVTDIDASTPSGGGQVSITYYPAGNGVFNGATANSTFILKAGQTQTIDLASVIPSGFVGSAWISSQYGVVVSASRVKTTMALTNTNVPSLFATTSPDNGTTSNNNGVSSTCHTGFCQMYAPLVYLDYNGWNTGFNIVNTSEVENQVTVNVVNRDGTTVGTYTTAIQPKGMQYVYIPATQDQGLGTGDFTAAILSGNAPFNAAVDEVKYSTGDAMSYNTTATLAVNGAKEGFFGNSLSLPLYQKGTLGTDGVSHGDTSGINLFNPTGHSVSGVVNFYMSTGAAAGSTQLGGGTPFTIGAMGSALVAYAPTQTNITPGSQLSAVVMVTSGQGGVVGVSNEVNYDVNGDGGVVFNLLNLAGQYRYPCSQTDCGLPVPPVSSFASKLTLSPNSQTRVVSTTATVAASTALVNSASVTDTATTDTVARIVATAY